MNLLPMDLSAPAGAVTAPVHALAEHRVAAWALQLQRAGSVQALPGDDPATDESCGLPLAPADPLPPRAAPEPPPGAVSEEPAPPRDTHEPETERAPLRVHVQHQPGDGLKVWLGIDGHAALVAQRATAAVADLRRSFGGERIAAVVCNGVPVYSRDELPIRHAPPEDAP